MVFDKKRGGKSLAMDESSLKAPIQTDSTLVPSFEEIMGFQVEIQKQEVPIIV